MIHAARVAMACDGMKDFRCVRRRKTPWVGFRRHASNFQHPWRARRILNVSFSKRFGPLKTLGFSYFKVSS